MPQFCMWENFQPGLTLKFLGPMANCETKDWQGEMNEGGEGRRGWRDRGKDVQRQGEGSISVYEQIGQEINCEASLG